MEDKKLKTLCSEMRKDILKMTNIAGSGHPGGSLSSVEIVAALYFGDIMKLDPHNPEMESRDRFILSKGHSAPVLYSALAHKGYFPICWLWTLRKFGSPLQGHPHAERVPGLDCSAGSLGQGLSIANGLGIGFKKQKTSQRVYCLMGDGELQEGQIWEAAMTAAHYHLDNVCGIVDWNHVQLDGTVEEVMDIGDLSAKWKDFGWHVIECDGHNIQEVLDAFIEAKEVHNIPSVVLAHTVKGKGISFMENKAYWHGTAPNDEQLKQALAELDNDQENGYDT
jgi:transketolase